MHQLVRLGDEGPTMFVASFYPPSVARRFDARQVGSEPTITLMRKAGVKVANGEQTLSAISADADVASILEISAGSPLLLADHDPPGPSSARHAVLDEEKILMEGAR